MGLQWRRKEARAGQRDQFYTIERDIAHIGIDLIRAGLHALMPQHHETWFAEFCADNVVTDEAIRDGVVRLAAAVNEIVRTKHPPAALEASGFNALPYAVQVAIYCKLGQVLLAAIWTGVKDVSKPESAPPASIEELLEDIGASLFHGDRTNGSAASC